MKVTLKQIKGSQFEAVNERGEKALIDGPPDVEGQGEGVRPMEMLLMSLAGCSAVDVLLILGKQRQVIGDLSIEVDGTRADAVPAVYTDIHLTFRAKSKPGEKPLDAGKLQRAVELSMEKYCSVSKMLEPTVNITHTAELVDG